MNSRERILLTFGLVIIIGIRSFCQVNDSAIQFPSPNIVAAPDTAKTLVEVGDVLITGFKKTKSYIIQREVPFKKGEHLLRSELRAKVVLCRQQLMNTSLFVDVEVTTQEINEIVFIHIHIKERWYLFPLPYFKIVDRNFNEWWVQNKRSLQRVNYGLKFMQGNVSGRNDKLNFWLVGGYTKQVSFRYENPFIDKYLKHGLNIGFSSSSNRELNYVTDSNKQRFLKDPDQFLIKALSVDLGYSYRPAIKTRHNFRISYADLQVKDTVVRHNSNFFPDGLNRVRLADISYTIQYFNVDYNPYPLKGFYGDAQLYKRFGKKIDQWQISGKGSYSFKLAPKSYMELQASGFIRIPFNQAYFSTRMFGTSDLYMRGLEYFVTQGVAGGIFRATAKREVLSFSIRNPIGTKTHDKIPFRIFIKGYGDAGYSYLPTTQRYYLGIDQVTKPVYSFLNNRLLHTGGIGIDVITFYDVVLKFEYSFNQFGSSGLFFHTKSDF